MTGGETALAALEASARQLLVIVGPAAALAVLLRLVERGLSNRMQSRFGWGGIYLTGWLGVPVHELSHALLCLPFGHKVEKVKLFAPDKQSGTLGAVEHAYNPKNPWAQMGRFFIGVAPLLGGSLVLWLLARTLGPVPQTWPAAASDPTEPLAALQTALQSSFDQGRALTEALITKSTWTENGLVTGLYLYLSLCVGAHLSPSRTDLKGGLAGLLALLVALVAANAIALATDTSTARVENLAASWASYVVALLALALTLSVMGLAVVTAVTALLPRRGS